MDNADYPQLEELITTLDRYLYEGFILRQNTLDSFEKVSKEPAFDLDTHRKKVQQDVHGWIEQVSDTLALGVGRWYYYYHFLKPYRKSGEQEDTHPLIDELLQLEDRLNALEEVIVRLEERHNLSVRKEIADKEYESSILYRVTLDVHTREIRVNNTLIARPNEDSKNFNFFEYVFERPNGTILVKDVEFATDMSLASSIQDILRDLGFKGNTRKVFFPVATKEKVRFMNPITKDYAIEHNLPNIDLPNKDNETKRDGTS